MIDVSIRSVQRWVSAYIQMGTKGLEIKKTGSTKSRITDEDRERDYAFCTF
jgi:transposase